MIIDHRNPSPSAHLDPRRSENVGSSESPILLGVNQFGSLRRLWREKHGLPVDPWESTESMRWGQYLEKAILEGFARELRLQVETEPGYRIHPSVEGMAASPDGECVAVSIRTPDEIRRRYETLGPGTIEVKNMNWMYAREIGTEYSPAHLCQTQHQIECVPEWRWGILGVLLDSSNACFMVIDESTEAGDQLKSSVEWFWGLEHEPESEYPADAKLVRWLYRHASSGKIIHCPEWDDLLLRAVERWQKAKGKEREAARAECHEIMGDAEQVILPDGRTVSAPTVPASLKMTKEWRRLAVRSGA